MTRQYLRELARRPGGAVAAALFRAQKSSSRAKCYGRTTYRDLAYDRKEDNLFVLAALLPETGWRWGWGEDRAQSIAPWVLYIDTPDGQVSFHAPQRGPGPDYTDEWDGTHESEARILELCSSIFDGRAEAT